MNGQVAPYPLPFSSQHIDRYESRERERRGLTWQMGCTASVCISKEDPPQLSLPIMAACTRKININLFSATEKHHLRSFSFLYRDSNAHAKNSSSTTIHSNLEQVIFFGIWGHQQSNMNFIPSIFLFQCSKSRAERLRQSKLVSWLKLHLLITAAQMSGELIWHLTCFVKSRGQTPNMRSVTWDLWCDGKMCAGSVLSGSFDANSGLWFYFRFISPQTSRLCSI